MMNDVAFYAYAFTVILGISSYFICIRFGIKFRSLNDYLYSGNKVRRSSSSIVGSVITVGVLFYLITACYLNLGFVVFPFVFVAACVGTLLFLRKGAVGAFRFSINLEADEAIQCRVQRILTLGGNRPLSIGLNLGYLLGMIATELAIFRNAILTLFPGDFWAALIVYVVFLTAVSYVYVGGFKGVLVTDEIQLGIMLVCTGFLYFSVPQVNVPNYVGEHFIVRGNLTTTTAMMGIVIIVVAWFGSAPELWNRLLTLPNRQSVNKSLAIAVPIIVVLVALPALLQLVSGVPPSVERRFLDSYKVWAVLLHKSGHIVALAFLWLIITALFTTIDTYLITISQYINFAHHEVSRGRLLPTLTSHVRRSTVVLAVLSLVVGVFLQPISSTLVGGVSGSLIVTLFIMQHVSPSLCRRFNVPRIPTFIHLSGVILCLIILPFLTFENVPGFPPFQTIPISLAFGHLLALGGYLLYAHQKSR